MFLNLTRYILISNRWIIFCILHTFFQRRWRLSIFKMLKTFWNTSTTQPKLHCKYRYMYCQCHCRRRRRHRHHHHSIRPHHPVLVVVHSNLIFRVVTIFYYAILQVNPLTPGNAWVRTQHCCFWCPRAKAPGHQYLQYGTNNNSSWPVSNNNKITFICNNIRKWNQILKNRNIPSNIRVNQSSCKPS